MKFQDGQVFRDLQTNKFKVGQKKTFGAIKRLQKFSLALGKLLQML